MRETKTKKGWLIWLLIGSWVTFTVSLIAWWYIFSIRQIERLSEADGQLAAELVRNQKMLMWEGATLVFSLIIGACTLGYYVIRDTRRSKKLMDFFLTFTHELKTPLSTLRLYAEALSEKVPKDSPAYPLTKDLESAADRLTLQLDNSLIISQLDNHDLLIEDLSFSETLRPLLNEFRQLNVQYDGEHRVKSDAQALSIILRNLFKNALTHGNASHIDIGVEEELNTETVSFLFSDNGEGVKGDKKQLGKRFSRLYRGSGTGIGLFLSSQLAEKMGGDLSFPNSEKGFTAKLILPKVAA